MIIFQMALAGVLGVLAGANKRSDMVTDCGILHYRDVIMTAIASQITSLTIVYSTVYSDADQRKHQSSASLAFVRRIHRGPVNSPHKWPVTRKMFPFDDVIMEWFICVALDKNIPSPYDSSSMWKWRWCHIINCLRIESYFTHRCLLTDICISKPVIIGSGMVYRMFGTKPFPEPMWTYCSLDLWPYILYFTNMN